MVNNWDCFAIVIQFEFLSSNPEYCPGPQQHPVNALSNYVLRQDICLRRLETRQVFNIDLFEGPKIFKGTPLSLGRLHILHLHQSDTVVNNFPCRILGRGLRLPKTIELRVWGLGRCLKCTHAHLGQSASRESQTM